MVLFCWKMIRVGWRWLGMSKKIKKPIKLRELEKNNWKNRTMKKNWLEFWKNYPVRFGFGFISLKQKKPNSAQTEKNRAKLEKNDPNKKKLSQTRKKPSQNRKKGPNQFLF